MQFFSAPRIFFPFAVFFCPSAVFHFPSTFAKNFKVFLKALLRLQKIEEKKFMPAIHFVCAFLSNECKHVGIFTYEEHTYTGTGSIA